MQVMLLGHSDSYARDKAMQVTIAFNHFGEGLIQRMPRYSLPFLSYGFERMADILFSLYFVLPFLRCRHGYFHVVNNDYTHWEMYAIGGSADPTINSQGNRYLAPTNPFAKEVIIWTVLCTNGHLHQGPILAHLKLLRRRFACSCFFCTAQAQVSTT